MARILIVDNDSIFHTLMPLILEPQGYQVDMVRSTTEALERVRAQTPALVMTDIYLRPPGNGFELIRSLREDPSMVDIPIFMVSAHSGRRCVQGAYEAGADGFIIKPFTIDDLLEKIRSYLVLDGTALRRLRADTHALFFKKSLKESNDQSLLSSTDESEE